jgi:hypothetical protein
MRTSEIKALLKTVKSIGGERYPDLDPAFLEAVVTAEHENPDDKTAALRDIEVALQKLLSRKGSR